MELTDAQRYWIKHVEACERAGMGYSEYCRKYGLNKNHLYGHRCTLKRKGYKFNSTPSPVFSEVRVEATPASNTIRQVRVEFSSGMILQLEGGSDSEELHFFIKRLLA